MSWHENRGGKQAAYGWQLESLGGQVLYVLWLLSGYAFRTTQ